MCSCRELRVSSLPPWILAAFTTRSSGTCPRYTPEPSMFPVLWRHISFPHGLWIPPCLYLHRSSLTSFILRSHQSASGAPPSLQLSSCHTELKPALCDTVLPHKLQSGPLNHYFTNYRQRLWGALPHPDEAGNSSSEQHGGAAGGGGSG